MERPKRTLDPGWLALALLACGEAEPARPNVLLVTLDTLRADALGIHGAGAEASPALDALAAQGVVFERCSATAGVTPSSHASILTGLYPDRHGLRVLRGEGCRLSPEVPCLAERLRAAGYATAAVHSAFMVSPSFGLERGFDVLESFGSDLISDPGEATLGSAVFQRRSDESVDLALAMVEGLRPPWFLWLHLFDPHDVALRPPAEFLEPLDGDPLEDLAARERLYAAEVSYQDRQLGRLLERARSAAAVVCVVGDHGEGLADGQERHGWARHALLYEEQLHVPFVLHGPGVPAGLRIAQPVSTVDVMPTLLELVGLASPGSLDGTSLVGALHGARVPDRALHAEQLNAYDRPPPRFLRTRPHDDLLHALREGRWKLLYRPAWPERSELFDLGADPLELDDRALREPERLRRLLGLLAERDPWLERPPAAGSPAGHERALSGLGYAASGDAAAAPFAWEWLCVDDGTRSRRRGSCAACGAPTIMLRAGGDLPGAR